MAELIIDGRKIEIHFAGKLGNELRQRQIEHYKTAQVQMIEQKIESKVLVSYCQRILLADKCKPDAELKKKITKTCNETTFKITLRRFRTKCEKVKIVRVFYKLLCELRLRCRQGGWKLLRAFPCRAYSALSIWWTSTVRLQPFSMV